MNKKTRPAYLGVLLGVALIGLGVAYEKLWCDPRELLQEPADRRPYTGSAGTA